MRCACQVFELNQSSGNLDTKIVKTSFPELSCGVIVLGCCLADTITSFASQVMVTHDSSAIIAEAK
jgi:hypothetical protein